MSASITDPVMARASPVGDARLYPPAGVRNGQGVPWRPRPRLKRRVEPCIQIASWNVGSMTGKARELVEVMREGKIEMMCVQETRWKGKSARELGEGYKIFYSGGKDGKNGVGVILSPALKTKVVDVTRPGDRLVRVKVLVGGRMLDVVSAYAPQVGRSTAEKESFFEEFEEMVLSCPQRDTLVVGADMNGHVGRGREGFRENHGGKGFGVRNEEGERLLECCESLDLAVTNTFFTKKEEHLITYKSGDHQTQIDYILTRRKDLDGVRNCRVIPGEAVVTQHRLLCMKMRCPREEQKKRVNTRKRVKAWKLKDPGEITNKQYKRSMNQEQHQRNKHGTEWYDELEGDLLSNLVRS